MAAPKRYDATLKIATDWNEAYARRKQITNLAHKILLRLNLYEIDSSEQTPSTETTETAEEQEVLDSEVVDDPVEPTRSDSDELNDMLKSAKRRRIEPTTPKRPLTNIGLLENLKREIKFYVPTEQD